MINRPLLSKGDHGDQVRTLQAELNQEESGLARLTVDGDFGAKTDEAVRAFQGREDLVVDGVAGDATWGALFQAASDDSVLTVDEEAWSDELAREQARLEWVAPEQARVLDLIPPGADQGQQAAIQWFVGIFGMGESRGSNLGPSLTPAFVDPYKAYWGLTMATGLAWCAMAAWAAVLEGQGHDYRVKAHWKKHCVLGNWWGSAYDTWRVASERGLWVPNTELATLSSSKLAAAILVKNTRDGSDPAASSQGGRWSGHVDIAVTWIEQGKRIQAAGGNLSNTAKPTEQDLDEYLGAVLFPQAA